MEDIVFRVEKDKLILDLPTKNKGKFRWKTRADNALYGEGFPTTTTEFTESAYVEWQIGYDSEVGHEKKTTILEDLIFVGANGKRKNPYELSEILHLLIQSNIIRKEDLVKLTNEIEKRDYSFDESFQIENSKSVIFPIEGFLFHKHDTVLPTFSYYDNPRGLSIEISIQKQQYASGVQPMVYLSIPIQNFENCNRILGKTSKNINSASLIVDKTNASVFLNLFVFFGMCSWKHKHDVLSILRLLTI